MDLASMQHYEHQHIYPLGCAGQTVHYNQYTVFMSPKELVVTAVMCIPLLAMAAASDKLDFDSC